MPSVVTSRADQRTASQPRLGQWVEIHDEPCRGGDGRYQLLVNHRSKLALRLTSTETELCRQLEAGSAISGEWESSPFVEDLCVQGFLVSDEAEVSPVSNDSSSHASFASTLDVRWKGANRLVCFIHDKGARHLFHPVAVLGQIVLALAGLVAVIVAACSHRGLELRVSPAQIPLIIGMSLVAVAVHELAHALVVVHCGRTVDAVGMRMFLGAPSFYVESVDALVLTRRQRMVQAAAGPWAEWLVVSVVALWLWQSPLVFAIPLVHRFVLLNAATIGSNLLPFAGLDGSWLLADSLGRPDLRERSRGAASRLLHHTLTKVPNSGEHWGLAGYSFLNSLVASLLVATSIFFWYQLFGNLVGDLVHRGMVGWIVLAAATFVLGRPIARAFIPRIVTAIDTVSTLWSQATFRMQWSWRVAAIKELATTIDELAAVSEAGLGILAGELHRTATHHGACNRTGSYALVHSRWARSTTYRPHQCVESGRRRAILITLDPGVVDRVLEDPQLGAYCPPLPGRGHSLAPALAALG